MGHRQTLRQTDGRTDGTEKANASNCPRRCLQPPNLGDGQTTPPVETEGHTANLQTTNSRDGKWEAKSLSPLSSSPTNQPDHTADHQTTKPDSKTKTHHPQN
ncbi:hypothetical protein ml_15 [Mollivirus sibericum]|uniref:hypothetical protein n=1 Tax=Mollivirus sibericum TaxID=1678078 RepID=UPI0006B2EC2D|nr:hypothetical protein ml_15 [Mollivirus sibericum]ALD61817.1 hypothetical protein ml_15 [Mollivirus sibericum]